jgi:TrpR family transcriptional regulator, trp operon repressor
MVDRIPDIARALMEMRQVAAVENLLRELLTESEVKKLSLRWDIVRCLSEGKSQRTIAHRLGVSLCKITRGARELKKKGSALKRVFEQQSSLSQPRS